MPRVQIILNLLIRFTFYNVKWEEITFTHTLANVLAFHWFFSYASLDEYRELSITITETKKKFRIQIVTSIRWTLQVQHLSLSSINEMYIVWLANEASIRKWKQTVLDWHGVVSFCSFAISSFGEMYLKTNNRQLFLLVYLLVPKIASEIKFDLNVQIL